MIDRLRAQVRLLKRDTYALYLVCRDPRTPWYAKVLAGAVVAYALSPIDLIPDFIPIAGQLDDLVLVPLGIAVVLRLVPDDVMADCRLRAESAEMPDGRWVAAAVVAVLWIGAAVLAWRWVRV